MKLALDHHYPRAIATQLRAGGHDVVTAAERGWEQLDDESLLARCLDEGRTLLTNNVRHFAPIARDWALQGRQHAGLLFTSDRTMPRSAATVGRYVQALVALMADNPSDDAFVDRVEWLTGDTAP